jgi:dTDP-glucose 4,6-dehydratase
MMLGRRAFVTGAGGFIGSHLVDYLLDHGTRVRALIRYNSGSKVGWLQNSKNLDDKRLEIVFGDITHYPQMLLFVTRCD